MSDVRAVQGLGGRVCVVAFSSTDRFEWGRALLNLAIDHVLLRDSARGWYQDGVRGLGDRQETVRWLRKLADQYEMVIALGLSAGAYAALLYGQLAVVPRIVAVSPVSGAGERVMDELHPEWHHRVAQQPGDPRLTDLRDVFQQGPLRDVRAYVSDGPGTELDAFMARRIMVEPILIPGHSHPGLARHVRDSGLLREAVA